MNPDAVGSNYFQGTIQLRNPHEEAFNFIEKSLGKYLTKIEKVRNGFDFYVKDKKVGEVIGRKTRDKFGGEFNVAASLHTRDHQTSRDLYRLNVLIRLPDFKAGDVIKFDNKIILIKELNKKIAGEKLDTRKNTSLPYPNEYEILEQKNSRVVVVEPNIEIMDPETYQPILIKNKPKL